MRAFFERDLHGHNLFKFLKLPSFQLSLKFLKASSYLSGIEFAFFYSPTCATGKIRVLK